MESVVEVSRARQVATLTLNRPGSMNALNREMAEGLQRALQALAQRAELRCLIVRGAGVHFMAGGDIRYFQSSLQRPGDETQREIAAVIDLVNASTLLLRRLPIPVVASVRGSVAGFGVSLVAACDLAIAADDARFTQAYTQIATTPDGGNTYFLPRQIGLKQSMALTLLNETLDAEAAQRIGLINRVVAGDRLEAETDAVARRLCRGSKSAHAGAKRLLNASFENSLQQQLALEKASFLANARDDDFREGVDAFLAKRKPDFT